MKKSIIVLASMGLLSTAAFAQSNNNATIDYNALLNAADDYGYSHYIEVSFEDSGRIDVDGWLGDSWHAETEIAMGGRVLKEEKQRKIVEPWGLTRAQLDTAIERGKAQGMATVEEIDIDDSGVIEVEGEDAQGRDVEHSFLIDELAAD